LILKSQLGYKSAKKQSTVIIKTLKLFTHHSNYD